jgi:hypothetical protein
MGLHQLKIHSNFCQEDYKNLSLQWLITDLKKILQLLDKCINIFNHKNICLMSSNTTAKLNTIMKVWISTVQKEHLITEKAIQDIKMPSIAA